MKKNDTAKTALYYQNKVIKKILILGLGLSGQSTAYYLLKHYHIDIIAYDDEKKTTHQSNIKLIKNLNEINQVDLVIASPGFDLREKRFLPIQLFNCPIICDIELFYTLLPPTKTIIAVTGSNGKSTVTTLITALFNKLQIKAKACGNIGVAVFDIIDASYDIYVIELSSFQLDLLNQFKASVGIITNISFDHLDRYDHFEAYQNSKLSLVNRVNTFIGASELKPLIQHPKSYFFNLDSHNTDSPFSIFQNKEKSYIAFHNKPIISTETIALKGSHNWLNILAALIAIQCYFNDFKIPFSDIRIDLIKTALAQFHDLPSRCNIVDNDHHALWIDDSKGTNIGATKAAITGFCALKQSNDKKSIKSIKGILILGGLSKSADFTQLQPELDRYIKSVFIFGKDRHLIAKQIIHQSIYIFQTLDEIVPYIYKIAQKEDIILFSPACASFDQFDNYLARGQYFRNLVAKANASKQIEKLENVKKMEKMENMEKKA